MVGVLAFYFVQKSRFFIYDGFSYFFETTSYIVISFVLIALFFFILTELLIHIKVKKLKDQNLVPDGSLDKRIIEGSQENKRSM